MKLNKALEDIFKEYGIEMLHKEVLVNYLADYHAFEIKPTKIVLKHLLKLGYGEKIYMLNETDAPDKLLKIKSYASELVQNQGFQEIHVSYVFNSICYALGWIQAPPEEITTEKVVESSNYRNFSVGSLSFRMVYVKGASFDMGGTPEQGIFAAFDEKPPVNVSLTDYYIGETVVTQALWEVLMNDNPSHFKGKDLPVERVSWEECQVFISKLNTLTGCQFRLPSEAEWEFAARGGINTEHFKFSGCNDDRKSEFVWSKDNSKTQSHEVKSMEPNELGIYGMSGNISEWCQDWYFNSYANSGSRVNPTGPISGNTKVYRGGSWDDKTMNCRASKRFSMNPTYRNKLVGLRLAASIL